MTTLLALLPCIMLEPLKEMILQQKHGFTQDYANDNRESNRRRTHFTWEFPYYMINQTNSLINGVDASNLSVIDKAELAAQGKVIRAYFYFQLAMEFQHTYTYDSSFPAPPIYTTLSLEVNR